MSKGKSYHKLVRDKIPQVIKETNKEPFFYVANSEEVKPLILDKLMEELEEFRLTPNEEELADLLEVIDGIGLAFGLDMESVLKVKEKKKEERGGFSQGIVLERVE